MTGRIEQNSTLFSLHMSQGHICGGHAASKTNSATDKKNKNTLIFNALMLEHDQNIGQKSWIGKY